MSLCVTAGALIVALAGEVFTLGWTHTVERTRWEEDWRVDAAGIVLIEARIKGSGAGLEPGPDARLVDGWWRWRPQGPASPRVRLAGSQAAPEGWRLCGPQACVEIGAPETAFADGAEVAPCPPTR